MAAASSSSSQRGKAAGKRRSAEDEADEEDDDEEATPVLTAGNIMYYRSNKEDPNITINEDEDIDSEIDDYEITETDLVLLGARSDEQLSNLEVYIYEEPVDNLYPHHDIPLPVFPLCVAWLDHHPAAAAGASSSTSRPNGNYAAVGTFAPYIETRRRRLRPASAKRETRRMARLARARPARSRSARRSWAEHRAGRRATPMPSCASRGIP